MLDNRPHEGVVHARVLVSELVPEGHDSSSPCDCIKELRGNSGKRRSRLSDDDELALDRGADEAVALIRAEIETVDREG